MYIVSEENCLCDFSENICGILYITDGEYSFPGNGWTDLAVPVLNMWAAEFIKHSSPVRLIFMDGDFRIKGEFSDGEQLTLYCYDNYSCSGDAVQCFKGRMGEFIGSLICALERCAAMLKESNREQYGKCCEDIRYLKNTYKNCLWKNIDI